MTHRSRAHAIEDFTRWNRAGLDQVNYLDHGAAEIMQSLRIAHLLAHARGQHPDRLPGPDALDAAYASEAGLLPDGRSLKDVLQQMGSTFSRPHMDGGLEANATYEARLLAQYQAALSDPSAQIARAFSRAMQILTSTLEAYANEGTFRTASQRSHIYRHLALTGFRPSLAASAHTPVALMVKEHTSELDLPAGLGFDVPHESGAVLTYESLSTLKAASGLNELKVVGHDQRRDPITEDQTSFELASAAFFSRQMVGRYALLLNGREKTALKVTATDESRQRFTAERQRVGRSGSAFSGDMQTSQVASVPLQVHPVRPRGEGWIHFQAPPDSYAGQIICLIYSDGTRDFRKVREIRGRDLRYSALTDYRLMPNPPARSKSNRPDPLAGKDAGLEGEAQIDEAALGAAREEARLKGKSFDDIFAEYEAALADGLRPRLRRLWSVLSTTPCSADDPDAETLRLRHLGDATTTLGIEYVKPADALGEVAILKPGEVYVDGLDEETARAIGPVVLEHNDGQFRAHQMEVLWADAYGVALEPEFGDTPASSVATLIGGFDLLTDLSAETRNPAAAISDDGEIVLHIAENAAHLLLAGRRLLMVSDDRRLTAEVDVAEVLDLNAAEGQIRLRLADRGYDLSGFQAGFVNVYGNVVTFGHGKSQKPRVLGSGDGSQAEQVMQIADEPPATVLNAAFPGGVAPDLEISVDGQIWRQVERSAAQQGAASYHVEMQTDHSLSVHFHRRLISGTDNVMLTRFRLGAGRIGNDLRPFAATNLKPKHSAIEAIVQPMAGLGGADLRGVQALKSGGRSTYALFDRALGVEDFARLAETHSGVLHAAARLVRQGMGRAGNRIDLYIVPNGGNDVAPVQGALQEMLLRRALPGTTLRILPFVAAPLEGRADIVLKPGYPDQGAIRTELMAQLMRAFDLPARPLGRQLYMSEIVALIEMHPAVAHVTFTLTAPRNHEDVTPQPNDPRLPNAPVQVLRPEWNTSVYLARADGISLTFRTDPLERRRAAAVSETQNNAHNSRGGPS